MLTLFDNWVQYKGMDNKMYTQCDNMKKRFEKFIEKNRNKFATSESMTPAALTMNGPSAAKSANPEDHVVLSLELSDNSI